jgi:hypothetical protein
MKATKQIRHFKLIRKAEAKHKEDKMYVYIVIK